MSTTGETTDSDDQEGVVATEMMICTLVSVALTSTLKIRGRDDRNRWSSSVILMTEETGSDDHELVVVIETIICTQVSVALIATVWSRRDRDDRNRWSSSVILTTDSDDHELLATETMSFTLVSATLIATAGEEDRQMLQKEMSVIRDPVIRH